MRGSAADRGPPLLSRLRQRAGRLEERAVALHVRQSGNQRRPDGRYTFCSSATEHLAADAQQKSVRALMQIMPVPPRAC